MVSKQPRSLVLCLFSALVPAASAQTIPPKAAVCNFSSLHSRATITVLAEVTEQGRIRGKRLLKGVSEDLDEEGMKCGWRLAIPKEIRDQRGATFELTISFPPQELLVSEAGSKVLALKLAELRKEAEGIETLMPVEVSVLLPLLRKFCENEGFVVQSEGDLVLCTEGENGKEKQHERLGFFITLDHVVTRVHTSYLLCLPKGQGCEPRDVPLIRNELWQIVERLSKTVYSSLPVRRK